MSKEEKPDLVEGFAALMKLEGSPKKNDIVVLTIADVDYTGTVVEEENEDGFYTVFFIDSAFDENKVN